jgi:hypothetical protein
MFLRSRQYSPLRGLGILGERFIIYFCVYGGQGHYLNFSYQIPTVMYGNSLIYAMIKHHFDRKLSNKIAQCSAAGSRGLN